MKNILKAINFNKEDHNFFIFVLHLSLYTCIPVAVIWISYDYTIVVAQFKNCRANIAQGTRSQVNIALYPYTFLKVLFRLYKLGISVFSKALDPASPYSSAM